MQRGGVNHAVVMSLSWRQEPPALYNYQRWQGGDEGRKGQRKMTRGSNKLNSPPAGGCHLYSRCARRLNGACKITRTFIHEVADIQRANKQTVSYRCLKKGGVTGCDIPEYLFICILKKKCMCELGSPFLCLFQAWALTHNGKVRITPPPSSKH